VVNSQILLDAGLVGLFLFAAIHYAVQWWFARDERIYAVFAVQCCLHAAFCIVAVARYQATTVSAVQHRLDWCMSIGVLSHGVVLQLYAYLADRRDHVFRVVLFACVVVLVLVNQWMPIRGTVLELYPTMLPGGGTALIPMRTPPGVLLAGLYVVVFVIHGYGFVAARAMWKRNRTDAALVAFAVTTTLAATVVAILVDFGGMRWPYVGALPNAIFALCLARVFSRSYAVRTQIANSTLDHLEEQVALRTRELNFAKDAAERASLAKSEFLAHMSHEIRSPLGIMMLYGQVLQDDETLEAEQQKKVDIIMSSGRHLATVLTDSLEMSRIEAGRVEMANDRFKLRILLDEVEQMFAAQCTSKGLELIFDSASDLPRAVLGDAAKVRQILINLVSNALKFTERGSIRVSASARGLADTTRIEIVVADTGIGIADADLDKIFQPFEQLESGARAGGSGLGLAISLANARLMGGDLVVKSVVGEGSTFTFTFDATVLPETKSKTRVASLLPASSTPHKILVVDDLQHNRDILVEILSPRFETRTAASGLGALAVHADWRPDLVLMDLRMAEMNGLTAIRRLKDAGSKAAIGVLSASALPEDEREAAALGVDFFLRKPYDERDLLDHIARVLSARSP
jgi:signal transduction histidine kinase